VFSPKRRPERIDLGQRQAIALDVELARDGQIRLATEEILGEVDAAAGSARQVREIERAYLEKLTRALAIARGDDRRVDPHEAVLVKVAVHRLCDRMSQA